MDNAIGKRCEVTDDFLVKNRKRRMTKQGIVRGFYINEYWHPFTYRAFHIEFDDGTKHTYKAKEVKLV